MIVYLQFISSAFQSTPSVGRATTVRFERASLRSISIHALRGEGDYHTPLPQQIYYNFNPRPPWGGRQRCAKHLLSHRRISIHALRGEGDETIPTRRLTKSNFNPRPPWGGRRFSTAIELDDNNFNPRPPWGGRQIIRHSQSIIFLFQSTPSVGRATFSDI